MKPRCLNRWIAIAAVALAGSTAAATTLVRIEGRPGLLIQLDGVHAGEIGAGFDRLQFRDPTLGVRRVTFLRDGRIVHEGTLRLRDDNLVVLREPGFQVPPLPHPNEAPRVGAFTFRGFAGFHKLTIEGLLDDLPADGVTASFTAVPVGKYRGAMKDAMFGRSETIEFDVRPGQLTVLRGDSAGADGRVAYQSRMPVSGGGHDREVPGLGLHLVWVEAGGFDRAEFTRGSTTIPAASVRVHEGFWIGRTEVTQAQWLAVMGSDPSAFKAPDRPVEKISWFEAVEFCRRLTAREQAAGRLPAGAHYALPTELQWEYACRAGNMDRAVSFESLRASSWLARPNHHRTQSVGALAENAWGIADMFGNVAEWCLDEIPGAPDLRVARGSGVELQSPREQPFSAHALLLAQRRDTATGLRIVLVPRPGENPP